MYGQESNDLVLQLRPYSVAIRQQRGRITKIYEIGAVKIYTRNRRIPMVETWGRALNTRSQYLAPLRLLIR